MGILFSEQAEMSERSQNQKVPEQLSYCLQLAHCIEKSCEGKPIEIAHYERNNWATFELQCPLCKQQFVVKIEV